MGSVPARQRREFQKEESEICSFLAEETVSFAQLGVIMDGVFEDAVLGVRDDFYGREGKEYCLAQRRCQLLCTEQ